MSGIVRNRSGFSKPAPGIVAHNHPSGDADPSHADRQLTAKLREGAALLQINFTDHVIIGSPSPNRQPYFSFRDAGLL